jgi:hypothetical protein
MDIIEFDPHDHDHDHAGLTHDAGGDQSLGHHPVADDAPGPLPPVDQAVPDHPAELHFPGDHEVAPAVSGDETWGDDDQFNAWLDHPHDASDEHDPAFDQQLRDQLHAPESVEGLETPERLVDWALRHRG